VWVETIIFAVRRAAFACLGAISVTLLVGLAPVLAAPVPLSAVMGSPAEGTWRTANGTEVTIGPCATGLCGTLSWVVIPKKNAEQCRTTEKQAFASLMLDYSNPDKALQTRPLLGLTMLTLTATNDPTAFTAKVYNPEDGSTNDVQVFIMNGSSTLRIGGGCLGTMCVQSQDWPRVSARPIVPDFTCEGGQ
jgi:uncharacterized protein (DUF2147 family)